MPTSHYEHIPLLCEKLLKLNQKESEVPKRILDIGIGFGRNGMLVREFCEVHDRLRVSEARWRNILEGVEAYVPYIQSWTEDFYDKIYQGDILRVWDDIDGEYDFVIMTDVLTNLPKDKGFQLLSKLKERCTNGFITVRQAPSPRHVRNPHEKIQSRYTLRELKPYGEVVPLNKSVSVLLEW